jgi:outer membrane biogenesis lipoprotein LolB
MMLVKGKTVAAGGASLGFDVPVNALADSATGNLTISAPLGEKAGQTSVSTAGGVRVQTVNGQAFPGANAAKVPLPTWKEKQDKMN